jgi:N6-adenosine-specific RNA methylase IME4
MKCVSKDDYQQTLFKHGYAYALTPGLDKAICEAGLSLAHETSRDMLWRAIEWGRLSVEDGRQMLLLPAPTPTMRPVLLALQEAALLAAAGCGPVATRARELADDIAKKVGYKVAPRRFKVIYVDPPWKYQKFGDERPGSAISHYPTMDIEELKNLKVDLGWGPRRVKDLADPKGCALVIWMTAPKTAEGMELLKAWGFDFVTKAFLWVKKTKTGKAHYGTGVYTRSSDEDAWLGKIGKITPKSKSVRREVVAPVRRHSQKPEDVYERIEELWDGPYLELFSRSRRPGWCSWGNDAATRQRGRVTCPKP